MLGLCLLGSCLVAAAAEQQLPIVGWTSLPAHQATVERYHEMRDAGFTHSLSHFADPQQVRKALDAAAQAGIKLMVNCRHKDVELEKLVESYKDHPALGGYSLRDEPSLKDFAGLAQMVARVTAVDKAHPCYINLYPNNANERELGTPTYEEHVRRFIEMVELPFYSFDYYPIMALEPQQEKPWRVAGGKCRYNPLWYANLETFKEETQRVNKPFWAFALATAHINPPIGYYPIPTRGALKLQQYSNLAYGAQGLQYYTYWTHWDYKAPMFYHEGPIDNKGRRSPVFDRIREVNQELQARAFVFLGGRVEGVWHTGAEIPAGTKPLEALPPFVNVLETPDGGAIVSHIVNAGRSYLVIVSRELERELTLKATFAPGVNRIRKDGTAVEAARYGEEFWLGPGEAEIFATQK